MAPSREISKISGLYCIIFLSIFSKKNAQNRPRNERPPPTHRPHRPPCADSGACVFDAVCGMHRYSPPPPPPCKFEIIFAPRRIGILAGFALAAFAAPDAQAQTCSSGQFAYVNNACVDVQSGCETVDSAVNPIGGRYDSDASRCYLDTDGFHTITDNVAPYCRTDLVPANTCRLHIISRGAAGSRMQSARNQVQGRIWQFYPRCVS